MALIEHAAANIGNPNPDVANAIDMTVPRPRGSKHLMDILTELKRTTDMRKQVKKKLLLFLLSFR